MLGWSKEQVLDRYNVPILLCRWCWSLKWYQPHKRFWNGVHIVTKNGGYALQKNKNRKRKEKRARKARPTNNKPQNLESFEWSRLSPIINVSSSGITISCISNSSFGAIRFLVTFGSLWIPLCSFSYGLTTKSFPFISIVS